MTEAILSGEDQRLMVRAATRLTPIDEDTADALIRLKVRLQQLTRPTDPGEDKVEAVAKEIERYGEGLVPKFRIVCDWLADHFRNDEDARAAITAMGHTPPSGEDGDALQGIGGRDAEEAAHPRS